MRSSENKIKFIGSFETLAQLPAANIDEICFIGRSNVGKSSLINFLTSKPSLAKVSSKPGKTITFNYFEVNQAFYLVDLPGYGYAIRSKTMRNRWGEQMNSYFLKRENLVNVFLLIDARIPPQKLDLDLACFLGEHSIPFSILFTKCDKREAKKNKKNIHAFQLMLSEFFENKPMMLEVSAEDKIGREDLVIFLNSFLKGNFQ
ncbi:MAG: ribosome biogenesis GTP-binding protein YihA/YsxC [Chitinophagales bacterium]|jgi:GTP-binding protein|nr:ribosome biogenesis GTP-binding protein YihA/YsxC [Chitinophagales bacterium]